MGAQKPHLSSENCVTGVVGQSLNTLCLWEDSGVWQWQGQPAWMSVGSRILPGHGLLGPAASAGEAPMDIVHQGIQRLVTSRRLLLRT